VRYDFDDGSGKISGNKWPEKEGDSPIKCANCIICLPNLYALMFSFKKGHLNTSAFLVN
jgi:hypothetical protein